MPWVIKHKSKPRYVGNRSNADYDEDKLVSIDYARFYNSEAGAKQGLNSWCRYPVSRLLDQSKLAEFEIRKWP